MGHMNLIPKHKLEATQTGQGEGVLDSVEGERRSFYATGLSKKPGPVQLYLVWAQVNELPNASFMQKSSAFLPAQLL